MIMTMIDISLLLATLFCGLVAGFLFAFAIVVMPGIKSLKDREFLKAFQVMDRVIQKNQPLFILVWVGSIVTLILSAALSLWYLEELERWLLVFASLTYLLGVQLPTATINIPLNNELQTQDLAFMSESALATNREGFESQWVKWNLIRTVFAIVTFVILIF